MLHPGGTGGQASRIAFHLMTGKANRGAVGNHAERRTRAMHCCSASHDIMRTAQLVYWATHQNFTATFAVGQRDIRQVVTTGASYPGNKGLRCVGRAWAMTAVAPSRNLEPFLLDAQCAQRRIDRITGVVRGRVHAGGKLGDDRCVTTNAGRRIIKVGRNRRWSGNCASSMSKIWGWVLFTTRQRRRHQTQKPTNTCDQRFGHRRYLFHNWFVAAPCFFHQYIQSNPVVWIICCTRQCEPTMVIPCTSATIGARYTVR